MSGIDKAAIVWTIAIVAIGTGFAGYGLQNQVPTNSISIDTTPNEIEFQKVWKITKMTRLQVQSLEIN